MSTDYSINGIGYSPLGNWGLNTNVQYGSYDAYMPSMMGLNPMYANNCYTGINGMYGMYGMYPQYMTQMQSAYQNIEASQLQHAGNMQAQVLNNEVNAYKNTNTSLIEKISTDGAVQNSITNLYAKVKEGDGDAVCKQFDELRSAILTTYKNELNVPGDTLNATLVETIEKLYYNVVNAAANDGTTHTLRGDIEKHCESFVGNGFMSGFRRGHSEKSKEEVLNHCFGLPIDDYKSKQTQEGIAKGAGRVASVLEKGAYGAGATVAATGLGLGLGKLFLGNTFSLTKTLGKVWKPAALIGLGLGIVADIFWQSSES